MNKKRKSQQRKWQKTTKWKLQNWKIIFKTKHLSNRLDTKLEMKRKSANSKVEPLKSSSLKERKVWKRWPEPQGLWDNDKRYNIHITGVPEKEGKEKIFEKIMAETSPNLVKDLKCTGSRSLAPAKLLEKKTSHTHTDIVKVPKIENKEEIFKAAREKRCAAYRRARMWMAAGLSSEILEAWDPGQHHRPQKCLPKNISLRSKARKRAQWQCPCLSQHSLGRQIDLQRVADLQEDPAWTLVLGIRQLRRLMVPHQWKKKRVIKYGKESVLYSFGSAKQNSKTVMWS